MSWKSLETAAERGPIRLGCAIIVVVAVLGGIVGILGYGCGLFGEAASVTQEEFGPRALLEKYELFKDMHAQLDSKLASIEVYRQRVTRFEEDFADVPRPEWDRHARSEYDLLTAELTGMVAAYNSLAAEYNAAMAKFNYRFCNTGTLPEGATQTLPREVAPYEYGY